MKTEVICLAIFVLFCCAGVEASVSQCFFCVNSCSDPLDVENCPSTPGVEYRCLTMYVDTDGITAETKGCILASDTTTINDCDLIDSKDGAVCRVCDEDLCNSAGIYSISVILLAGLFVLIKVL